MTIREAIRLMATGGMELYSKVCTVDAVDVQARTVDCTPLDESAPLLGVNLQANQGSEGSEGSEGSGDGVVAFPAIGSYVVVSFISEAVAVVALTEKVDKIVMKIGETTAEAVDGEITLNGGTLGGLVITPKLVEELNKNNRILQAILDVIMSPSPIPEPGNGSPSGLQKALASVLTGKTVGDFSQIENDKIKH